VSTWLQNVVLSHQNLQLSQPATCDGVGAMCVLYSYAMYSCDRVLPSSACSASHRVVDRIVDDLTVLLTSTAVIMFSSVS